MQGLEYSPDSARVASEIEGLPVKVGELLDDTFAPKSFDVVTLWDVIEHFPDPRAVMELLGRLAAPGCLIFLTTGNVASPIAHMLGKHWRLITPLEHYSFFAPATMRRLLATAGFRTERITSPWKWVPVVLIAAQLERMLGEGQRAWRWIPRSWRVPLTLGDVMFVQGRRT